MEGIFARGDRKLNSVILDAYQNGCMFDAWSEFFCYEKWKEAFERNHLDFDFYTTRERKKDELLPWDFIDIGVSKRFLWKEYENALKENVTPNCRQGCSGCGAASFDGGVCIEPRG